MDGATPSALKPLAVTFFAALLATTLTVLSSTSVMKVDASVRKVLVASVARPVFARIAFAAPVLAAESVISTTFALATDVTAPASVPDVSVAPSAARSL